MTDLRVVPAIDPVGADRRERVYEVLGDYINDIDVDAQGTYDELLAEVEGWIKFHSDSLEKASKLYNLLIGRGLEKGKESV